MVQKATRPTDTIGVVGVVDPVSQAAGATSTGWFAVADFHSFMALIQSGVLGASATLDAKIEQATDGTGTGAKDVTGKAITQLVKASNDDDQAIIEFDGSDLDVDNDFTHARLTLTVATAASLVSAAVLGINPRYGPASDRDLASVVEVIGLDA